MIHRTMEVSGGGAMTWVQIQPRRKTPKTGVAVAVQSLAEAPYLSITLGRDVAKALGVSRGDTVEIAFGAQGDAGRLRLAKAEDGYTLTHSSPSASTLRVTTRALPPWLRAEKARAVSCDHTVSDGVLVVVVAAELRKQAVAPPSGGALGFPAKPKGK